MYRDRQSVVAGKRVDLGGRGVIKMGCSIGAAIFPGDGDSLEESVACAERTPQGLKREAKGGFALHGLKMGC